MYSGKGSCSLPLLENHGAHIAYPKDEEVYGNIQITIQQFLYVFTLKNRLCEEQNVYKGLSIIRACAHNSQDLASLPLVSAAFPGEGTES